MFMFYNLYLEKRIPVAAGMAGGSTDGAAAYIALNELWGLGLSKEDVQILTPMRKGPLGAVTLNTVLQRALNPPADDKAEALSGGTLFREGDKAFF